MYTIKIKCVVGVMMLVGFTLTGFAFAPHMSHASSFQLAALLEQLQNLQFQLEILRNRQSVEATTVAEVEEPAITTTVTAVPAPPSVPMYKISPNNQSFIQNRSVTTDSSNPYLPAAGATTGNLYTDNSQYTLNGQGNALPMRIAVSKSSYSLVAELPADVPLTQGSALGYYSSRSEARVGVSPLQHDQDYHFAFDVFIDGVSDLTRGGSGDWRLIQQIIQEKAKKDGLAASPTLTLLLTRDEQFTVVRRTRDDSYNALVSVPAVKGRWHRFEYEFRLGDNGFLRVWMNGTLIYEDATPVVFTQCPTEGENCSTASTKVGIYRKYSGLAGYNKIHFRNIVLGEI